MSDHITEWLGAYHDGELKGARLRRVEGHLDGCADCRAELEALRSLSALLQDAVPGEDFLPVDRFVANLALSLPRRPADAPARNVFRIAWWLVPVGLLLVWVVYEITVSLSSAAALAAGTGLIGVDGVWLQGASLRMNWFAAAVDLFGDRMGALGWGALAVLNDANLIIVRLVGRFIPQALLAAAYMGWLVAWWLGHQKTKRNGV
jgi:anti-sigma factor RsiW